MENQMEKETEDQDKKTAGLHKHIDTWVNLLVVRREPRNGKQHGDFFAIFGCILATMGVHAFILSRGCTMATVAIHSSLLF